MSNYKQEPFAARIEDADFNDVEFADNPEPRCPVVLLLDTSSSMSGKPIEQLNKGLQTFCEEVVRDSLAAKRVELSLVTFGPVEVHSEFQSIHEFYQNYLEAGGHTPMGQAIETAVDLINDRKDNYRKAGIQYYRPWIFLISDGEPTDDWKRAKKLIEDGESNKEFMFFAVGVEEADMNVLSKLSEREALKLKELSFVPLFRWLSNSMGRIADSNLDDTIKLPSPRGWAEIG